MASSYYSTCCSVPLVRNNPGSALQVWRIGSGSCRRWRSSLHRFTNLANPKSTVLRNLCCWDEWKIPFASCEHFLGILVLWFDMEGKYHIEPENRRITSCLTQTASISGFTKLSRRPCVTLLFNDYLAVDFLWLCRVCRMGDFSLVPQFLVWFHHQNPATLTSWGLGVAPTRQVSKISQIRPEHWGLYYRFVEKVCILIKLVVSHWL